MKQAVCHLDTSRAFRYTVAILLTAVAAFAQVRSPSWRRVGGPAVDLNLASPATGPMRQVWFSADGSTLYARTASGQVYATSDFEAWRPAPDVPAPPDPVAPAPVVRLPEPGARLVAAYPYSFQFAIGRHLSRSDDGGYSWTNLTAYKAQSVVGFGQAGVAVSPTNPDQVALANNFGVWRSMDGGLSWTGLNLTLPNLAVRRILATPTGGSGVRVLADGMGPLELAPSGTVWEPAPGVPADDETLLAQRYSKLLAADVSAASVTGDTVMAGSADGRIWWSQDGGKTMNASLMPPGMEVKAGVRVERIWVDPSQPQVALAALSGPAPHVLRTTSRGQIWDALDSAALPNGVWAVAGDRPSGSIYVATDKGVFYGHADLEFPVIAAVAWQNITPAPMPAARATDVRLDPAGVQLYIAIDGYGVYRAPAPHRADGLRIVNAADFSSRAAAPGSLLSMIGAPVSSVRGANLDFPVLQVLDSSSQVQVPFETVGPNVLLTIQTSTGPQVRGIAVQPVSPALLTGSDGVPVVADADSGLAIDGRNPAHSGARIQIMATGLGKVKPEWRTGIPAPADDPPEVVATVRAFLDGKPLQVTRATLAPLFIGFYVVEIQLPPVANAGASVLHISADGQESNRVQLVMEP
jgi:uncharacterized protein (TIGR03437 family)